MISPLLGMRYRFALTVLVALFVAGCAAPPVKTRVEAPSGWIEQQRALAQITHWSLSGKLGVRQDDRIDSAVINEWTQQDDQFDIKLSSAVFGLGATQIRGTPEAIWFTRSGEEPLYSDAPEALIHQQVGWTLPISHLFYWIKGIPAPADIDDIQFTEAGRLYQLQQQGWTIRYDDFLATEPYPLPRKLVLERSGIRLTLIIQNWQIDPSAS